MRPRPFACFFFNDTATTEIYTLSLHDALPISDHHGGQTVFYQVGAERLALYVDLGLAALKIGEEARVPLAEFSLEGATRSESTRLNSSHSQISYAVFCL